MDKKFMDGSVLTRHLIIKEFFYHLEKSNVTQVDIANALGVSVNTIGRWKSAPKYGFFPSADKLEWMVDLIPYLQSECYLTRWAIVGGRWERRPKICTLKYSNIELNNKIFMVDCELFLSQTIECIILQVIRDSDTVTIASGLEDHGANKIQIDLDKPDIKIKIYEFMTVGGD